MPKLYSIPTFWKNYSKTFWKVLTNTYFIQYNEVLFYENHNQLHILTEFGSTDLHRTRLRYAKRKYRRFWNCFELSATDKRNRQFRLWILKPVTSLWNQKQQGISLSFCIGRYTWCAGFFCCPNAGYNWMIGWMGYDFATTSFFGEWAEQRRLRWGQGQKNDIQTNRRKTTDRMRQKECRIP